MNTLPTIKDIKKLKGTRVILRLDLNVPIKNRRILETMRIDRAISTIEYLVKRQAQIIIMSHIGEDGAMSLKPVCEYLSKILNRKIQFISDFYTNSINNLENSGIIMFENLRLNEGEIKNDLVFSKHLASFGDIYINDAFAVSHRKHASIVGIPKYLPSYVGLLIIDEIKHLSLALNPQHPFLFILGGAKFETKMPLMKKFCKIADQLFIGGVLANNFFHDQGIEVGVSVVDTYNFSLKPLLKTRKILLPQDVIIKKDKNIIVKNIQDVAKDETIVDVGPETIKKLELSIKKAKLIVWNGPLGYYEAGFDKATIILLKMIADKAGNKTKTIIGGGDTVAIVDKLSIANKFTFVSTGGGATLDFLVDGKLPGLDAISKSKKSRGKIR